MSRFPVSTARNPRANGFPAPSRRFASKRWSRTGRRSRPARRISSGKIFRAPAGFKFQTRDGKQEFGWTTSWGMTTRMIGTLIMTHADDDGLVLPPRIAPTHVVIMPITPKEETRAAVFEAADKLAAAVASGALLRRAARSGSRSPRSRRWRQELGMDQERRAVAGRAWAARSGIRQRRGQPSRSAGESEGVSSPPKNSSGRPRRFLIPSRRTCSSAPQSFGMRTRGRSIRKRNSTPSSRRRIPPNRKSMAALPWRTGMAPARWKSRSRTT